MLKLFALFHLNLMYSSLGKSDRADVVRCCYHPLLDLAEHDLPVAVEATGITLEQIKLLDPGWLSRLQELQAHGKIEFVGSGYSQIIGPLVPALVNAWNLQLGATSYTNILGLKPRIWLINEMAYSAGLPQQYLDCGAEALVMEWNNARSQHPAWSPRLAYHRQVSVGNGAAKIPLIWVDTINFQQLQRLVHQELEDSDFLAHWQGRYRLSGGTGFASFYGNDAEIFGFRPGRYATERPLLGNEWGQLAAAVRLLAEESEFEFVSISEVLKEPQSDHCGQRLHLEAVAMPIVVKKQEKYNLSRWALTGRGDLEVNTACFRIAEDLAQKNQQDPAPWRRLCRLWSSDFRTHITSPRWREYLAEVKCVEAEIGADCSAPLLTITPKNVERKWEIATTTVRVVADPKRGMALGKVFFPAISDQPVVGTIRHGFFDDIALGADFYTGHAVVQRPGCTKVTDLVPCQKEIYQGVAPDGRLVMATKIQAGELTIQKQVVVSPQDAHLELRGKLILPERTVGQIRPLHITVWPGFLDPSTMAFAVCNGGEKPEVFPFGVQAFDHGEPYSTLVTAKSGLGATDGKVIIGDAHKRLTIFHDHKVAALIPMVCYVPQTLGPPLVRLYYSAQEIDETFSPSDGPWQVSWVVNITAEKRGLEQI